MYGTRFPNAFSSYNPGIVAGVNSDDYTADDIKSMGDFENTLVDKMSYLKGQYNNMLSGINSFSSGFQSMMSSSIGYNVDSLLAKYS